MFTCVAFKHVTSEQQSKAKAAQLEQLLNKEIARGIKETYKTEGNRNTIRNLQVYAFDLQKVLHTPFGKMACSIITVNCLFIILQHLI